MKVLLFGDMHLHDWGTHVVNKEVGLPKKLVDQVSVLEQIIKLIKELNIGLTLFGGDLFHKVGEVPVIALNIANYYIKKIQKVCTFIMTRGNHDLVNNKVYKGIYDAVKFLDNYDGLSTGINLHMVHSWENVDEDNIKGYDIVILHKQPALINKHGHHFAGVDWKKLADNNRLVFFAHDHTTRKLSDNCFVMGSPLPMTFDDEGDRGVWVVDTDNWGVEFIPLKSPKYITVNTNEEVKDDYNYYRVLNADSKMNKDNVVNVTTPEYFEEKIKSNDFNSILNEWVGLKNKGQDYLKVIEDVISDKVQLIGNVFKGRLLGVYIKGFLSVGEVEYNVNNGFTSIKGNSDVFSSNGAGKTSLFDAIYWALTGKTTRGLTGDDVIRDTPELQEDCIVRLFLSYDYIIERSRKKGLVVTKNGSELTKGLKQQKRQQLLENQVLGFNGDLFLTSCYFSQEGLTMLTNIGDTDKTNLISNLLGFESFTDLYDRTSLKIKSINEKISVINLEEVDVLHKIDLITSKIESNGSAILQIDNDIQQYTVKIVGFTDEINELNSMQVKDDIDPITIRKELAGKDVTLKELQGVKGKLNEEINTLGDTKNNAVSLLNNVRLSITKVDVECKNFVNNISILRSEAISLVELKFGERCNKCGSAITEDNIGVFVTEKKSKITEFKQMIFDKEQTVVDIKKQEKILMNDIYVVDNRVHQIKLDLCTFDGKINKVYKEKDLLNSEQHRLETERSTFLHNVNKYKELIKEQDLQVNKLNERKKQLITISETLHAGLLELNSLIVVVKSKVEEHKSNIEKLEFWKVAFSPKGIKPLLLSRFCNEFNKIISVYIAVISNNLMGVTISPTDSLKSGSERNKLGIAITIGNRVTKYIKLSPGEKQRVNISLCLALNKWVSNKYDLESGLLGILVLDELFSYIDKIGEELIAMVLSEESKNKAVFVISHTFYITSYADVTWDVIKEGGVSRLECIT